MDGGFGPISTIILERVHNTENTVHFELHY